MSTESPRQPRGSDNLQWLAKGADRMLVRLLYLSPIALVVLLAIDSAHEYGATVMGAALAIAMMWATYDLVSA